ncbi:hypothetical protein SAMN05216266_109116 [Amycolatopsis marina]|uniref:Uncharacterized protein n=1 Tax=Amycolatopsis marina TaxID=490629 RepID=A0A1I1AFY9_9PSEU|nr:hypothetical protein [Amycolatopsis marina]SFB36914.1 hypothetical protein SAMN05216266_109116 [Amycolatopsis marina]
MDPLSGSASGDNLAGRLSLYVVMQLASVLLPGAVVLMEGVVLLTGLIRVHDHAISSLFEMLARVGGIGGFVVVIVAVAGSYVIGYLCRSAAFAIFGLVERRTRPLESRDAQLRLLIGDDHFAELVRIHPVLGSRAPEVAKARLGAGGGHRDGAMHDTQTYCKLWLRRQAPELAIDSIEAEINILLATVFPVLLLAVDAVALGGTPLPLRILALPLGLLVCAAVVRAVLRLRDAERWEAVRNLAFDFLMHRAALCFQQPDQPR